MRADVTAVMGDVTLHSRVQCWKSCCSCVVDQMLWCADHSFMLKHTRLTATVSDIDMYGVKIYQISFPLWEETLEEWSLFPLCLPPEEEQSEREWILYKYDGDIMCVTKPSGTVIREIWWTNTHLELLL